MLVCDLIGLTMTLSSATTTLLHALAITYALWLLYVLVMGLYTVWL